MQLKNLYLIKIEKDINNIEIIGKNFVKKFNMKEQAWNYRSSVAKALNGTGEGGASKIHYYRIDNTPMIQELKSLGYEDDFIVSAIYMYCLFSHGYIFNDDDATGRKYISIVPIVEDMWYANRVNGLMVSEDIYFGEYPYISKGDLYTKINNYIKMIAMESPEEAEIVKSVFDICLKHTTEITEDEFFGMCGSPIAPLPE